MVSISDDIQKIMPEKVIPNDTKSVSTSNFHLVPDIAGLIIHGLQLWSDVDGPGLVLNSLHIPICVVSCLSEGLSGTESTSGVNTASKPRQERSWQDEDIPHLRRVKEAAYIVAERPRQEVS